MGTHGYARANNCLDYGCYLTAALRAEKAADAAEDSARRAKEAARKCEDILEKIIEMETKIKSRVGRRGK